MTRGTDMIRGTDLSATDLFVEAIAQRVVELLREQCEAANDVDAPMPATRAAELRPGVTASWLRRHVAPAGRGARRVALYRLSDVDAAIARGAAPPAPPTKRSAEADPIEAMLASGELVRRA